MVDVLMRSRVFLPTRDGPLRLFPNDYPFPEEVYDPVWLKAHVPCVRVGRFDSPRKVLFFHGNAGTLLTVRPVAKQLAARCDACVFVVEFPGFWRESDGRSTAPTERRTYTASTDAAQALRKMEGDFHVVGYSLGTACAVRVAATVAGVRSLTLFAPLCSAMSVAAHESGRRSLMSLLCNVFSSLDVFRADLDAPKVRVASLVLHGDADETVPLMDGKRMASLIRGCSLRTLPGVTHSTILSSEDALNQAAIHIKSH